MWFLDIKDPSKRATLVKVCVTATRKTAKQRNILNRGMKLAIGDELQTLFHPIANATNDAAEETRKELAPRKSLRHIDRALAALGATGARPPLNKITDTTFGINRRQNGPLGMGSKAVRLGVNGKTLTLDDTEYKITPGLQALIALKHPRPSQWHSNDNKSYKSLVAQTKVRSQSNRTDTARPHATWKWKQMLKTMVMPGESIAEEESEDTDDTDSVESYPDTASTGDLGESSDIPGPSVPSPLHTRCYGKPKRTKDREPFYKGYGVVYLLGDTNGLAKKLHLFAAEFFAGNTSFSSIIMIVYKSRRFTMRRYRYGVSGIVDMIGSLVARYATKAVLATAAKTATRGTLDAAKRAVPHLIAHKVASTIAAASKKRKQ